MSGLALATGSAQTNIQWGLTLTNINNPTSTVVVTNSDGSISITTGGGDTYTAPDSFTYAYQQVTGDFDIRVQIVNVTATDPQGQDSPKGSLMVRADLSDDTYDFMINALPLSPSGRNGQIESIGRMNLAHDTDDLPGRNLNYGGNANVHLYGGDTTDFGYCTYPDVWLRIQRQGNKLMSYFATDNTEDIPQGSNPGSTNGWQLLCVAPTSTNFPDTLYIGLSTVAHNSAITNDVDTVTSTYANYGPTPLLAGSPSIPTTNGVPVDPSMAPGAFPTNVVAVNWDVSLPTNGLGFPGNIAQSNQDLSTYPQQIIWDSGGYASVARDILADINGESAYGFAAARYQCSGFDYTFGPHDPLLAQTNLGPYSNPARERYSNGDPTVPACQSWCPSPNYGFAFATIHKTGADWNDDSPPFFGAVYVQLDGIASSQSYDMIGGHFRGGQAYTRTTKLVVGNDDTADGAGSNGNPYRCAISHSLAYFPYSEGWKAGYFDDATFSTNFNGNPPGVPMWKDGDGWGMNSGTAVDDITNGTSQANYNSPAELLTWVDSTNGLAMLSLPGVNSLTDGMLFTVGNAENNGLKGPSANNAALPDGSGWYVAVRDIATSSVDPTIYATDGGSDSGSSFSFLFIPWDAGNLIGGHIKGSDGSTVTGVGNYTIQHLGTGRYALTIPGKTDANGMLMLLNSGYLASQPSGFSNVVDNSFMSYEYGGTNTPGNAFIISSVFIDTSGGGEGVVAFRDADFNFAWVDFAKPLTAPSSTIPPVLSITRNGTNVIVGWNNGPGFILESSPTLSSTNWANLGTQNPQTIAIIPTQNQFFRVVSAP